MEDQAQFLEIGGPDQPNPFGMILSKSDRHVQIGRIINASFPVPWLPYLSDPAYFLQNRLIPYIMEAEHEAFRQAYSLDDYHRNVELLLKYAIDEDQKWKAIQNPWADIAPESELFPVSQFFAHLMQFCKQIDSIEISESILFITCGMICMPPPVPTDHQLVEGDAYDARRLTTFRLLKWVFPDPYPDGENHFNRKIIQFGCTVEKGIWNWAASQQEYYDCTTHVQGRLIGMKREEDVFHRTVAPYLALINPIQPAENVEEEPEEEEEEEEEEENEEENGFHRIEGELNIPPHLDFGVFHFQ